MPKYKGIEFPNGYKTSFGQFKKDFSDSHVFKDTPAENLDSELEKAYEFLTNQNGKLQSTTKESKKSDTDTVK